METNSDSLEFPHWFSKSEATHDVARGIMQYGPIARTPLAQIFNLSQGALSRITSDLIYDGVIEEMPAGSAQTGTLPEGFTVHDASGRRGRPQTALRIREDSHTFIGVNIHDIVMTANRGTLIASPNQHSYSRIESRSLNTRVGMPVACCTSAPRSTAESQYRNPIDNPDKSYGLAGHVLIDPKGPRCSSGHVGCSQCLTSDSIAEEYSAIVGRVTTFEEFARDLHANTPQARRLGERTCFRLGVLVATVSNLAMPTTVLISGESSFIAKKNREFIRKGIDTYRHSQAAPVSFSIPEFSWRLWSDSAAARAIAAFIS
mgnify:CR=1 FL=1